MLNRNLCSDPLTGEGDSWPLDDPEDVVGIVRYDALPQASDLETISSTLIHFASPNASKTTKLMKERLLKLATKVSAESWDGGPRKLRVEVCFISGDDPDGGLHLEARIASLRTEPFPVGSEERLKTLQRLACLCQESGFEHIALKLWESSPYIYVAVPRDVLEPGESWPSSDIDRHVGPVRYPIQSADELYRMDNNLIAFSGENARRTTILMKKRLEDLASKVNDFWGDSRELKVENCYIPLPPSATSSDLHSEARIVDLRVKNTPPAETVKTIERLGNLCQHVGFELVQFINENPANPFIHAAVPRDNFLFILRESIAVEKAKTALKGGWLKFSSEFFKLNLGHPTLLIDGSDVSLNPILFDDEGKRQMKLGEILLSAANHRGLSPKAYFLNNQSCIMNQPIIRLIPSPFADLSTILSPVDIESLELSLRRYSDSGESFIADRKKGETLEKVIEKLTDSNGRYYGIKIHLHNVLKSQIPDTSQPPYASLTNILDALAFKVHGSWHWIGPKKINFISRPYSDYIGNI